MSKDFKPWAEGPFELVLHGEIHYQQGQDYDRRLALISFDNSIEVAVNSYLSLNPIQRNGVEYQKDDIDRRSNNFHTKLAFLEDEVKRRGVRMEFGKDIMAWHHDHRNEHYHGGSKGIPDKNTLESIRASAIWVFGMLFDVLNVEYILTKRLRERTGNTVTRTVDKDKVIDDQYGLVSVGSIKHYSSDLLYYTDPIAYEELALSLLEDK